MAEIINLHEPKNGDQAFMMCPCKSEPTPYIAVAIVGNNPIICGLLCPECETYLPINNGIVSPE